MAAPTKQLTPAELAALEHAFAADPSSDAYRPLTEAYLALGRFMEAMVVCKKGVKAHPGGAAARVLLARVYAEQGKDRKALEELQAALESHPQDLAANRMAGTLHMKLGEKEQGTAALQRAASAAPNDQEILEALKKWGVALPASPPAREPSRFQGQAAPVVPRVAPPAVRAPSAQPAPSGAPDGGAMRAAGTAPAVPMAPAAPPARKAPERDLDYARELADKYGTEEYRISTGKTGELPLAARRKGPGLRATLLLLVLLGAALVGWSAYTSWRKARDSEIAKLLKDAGEFIAKDSYASYQQASKLCEQVLEKDSDSLAGHAFLAYVDTLRWGELGEGDALREEAKKHLEAAKRRKDRHSHLIAADAYLQFYGGDPKGAIETLERVLKGPEGGTSGLLYGALGVVQMQSGDLDGAKESLTTARKFADRDVRVNEMLAEQYRRRGSGSEMQAKLFYDAALRLNPDHVPSLLGASMVYVEEGQYDTALKGVQKVLDSRDASNRQLALARVIKGSILYAKGKPVEGAEEEKQALELDRTNPDIQDLVARRKLRDGDVAGAVDSAQHAVQMDPQRVAFYVDLAAAMMRKENGAKQAVQALKNATERQPGNARLVKLLGDAYRSDGDLEHARLEYEKAISIEKRYPDARMALARTWRERREWAKALDEIDRAIKEYAEGTTSGTASAYVEKAEIEEARGSTRDAVREQYERGLKADPRNCKALWWLGRDRVDPASPKRDAELARLMFSDYARLCTREPHAAEAARLAATPAAPVRPGRSARRR
jgi:tetratricopeptide (TPR) repeat protein